MGRSESVELNEFPGKCSAAREAHQVNEQELQDESLGFASQSKAASPSFMGLSRAGFGEAVRMDMEPISESSQARLDTAVQNVLEREHSHTGTGVHAVISSWTSFLAGIRVCPVQKNGSGSIFPPPALQNLSQNDYKCHSFLENLECAAGISEQQQFVPGCMVREEADTTLGSGTPLKNPSYKLLLLDVKVSSTSGCNSGSG